MVGSETFRSLITEYEVMDMITTKTVYKVPNILESDRELFSTPVGIWCADNIECENMSIEDAQNNSVCLSGNVIDESIKDCLVFTFLDVINYGIEKNKFVKIEYKELIAECETIETIVCE